MRASIVALACFCVLGVGCDEPTPDARSPRLGESSARSESRERRPHAESFLTSILINEIPYPDPADRSDLSDPATCERAASDIVAIIEAQGREAEGFRTEVIELPVGRSCRYRFNLSGDEPHTSQGTTLQSDAADFMVVCNIAEGDTQGRAACDEVVRGWRWKS